MDVELLLVPYDTGLRGWRMGAGPDHLVGAGLVPYLGALGYSVASSVVTPEREGRDEVGIAFEIMRSLARRVRAARAAGRFPLILSGNCHTAPGTLAGLTPLTRAVFWLDAHADCNTPETTTSGFLDGMALAIAMGWCWRQITAAIPGFQPVQDRAVFLLGTRDIDALEAEGLSASAVRVLSPASLLGSRLGDELTSLGSEVDLGYLHCDLDVLDLNEGQANPFPVPGGLTVADVERLARVIGMVVPLGAAALTAYAPEYDHDGRIARAAFRVIEAVLAAAAGGR